MHKNVDDNPAVVISRIVLLKDELKRILKERGRIVTGTNKPAFLAWLGHDHPKCLYLASGERVGGDYPQVTVRKYTNDGTNHLHPPLDVLVRLGVWGELTAIATLLLVLKGQWERYFFDMVDPDEEGRVLVGMQEATGKAHSLTPVFARHLAGDDEIGAESAVYIEVHDLLTRYFPAAMSGLDVARLRLLATEMLLMRMHLGAYDAPAVVAFERRLGDREAALADAEPALRDTFREWHEQWLLEDRELGEAIYKLGHALKGVEKTRLDWLVAYGDLRIPLRKLEFKRRLLCRQIELAHAHPTDSAETIRERAMEQLEEERREIERLEDDYLSATLNASVTGESISGEEAARYPNEIRKVYKRIFQATAPDRVAGEGFTTDERDRLARYFFDAMALYKDAAWFSGPSLEQAEAILRSVKALWDNKGLNIDEHLQIPRGLSLEEQVDWLEREVRRLRGEVSRFREERKLALEHPDHREMSTMVADKATIETLRKGMEQRREEFVAEIRALKEELAALYAEVD